MQSRRGNIDIDTDRDRLDFDRITDWLQASYWASSRSKEAILRSWQASGLTFGMYDGRRQIGCARVVTDFVAHAYLADVYLEPGQRGQGLGRWLVEAIVASPELASVGWLLHTRDAHHLYENAGFVPANNPRLMERPRPG